MILLIAIRFSHHAGRVATGWFLVSVMFFHVLSADAQDIPAQAASPPDTLTDIPAAQLMDDLVSRESAVVGAALKSIQAGRDSRFISVLVEMMRAIQLRLLPWRDYEACLEVLSGLSGNAFGDNFGAWVEWYGGTDLAPPPGFTGWKGRLFSRLDPRFGDFLKEEHPRTLRVEEILWGGVRVDGIPPLDQPAMTPSGQASYLAPGDLVFGLKVGDDARAYPLKIMDWHEMANDVVGGVPVSLAYCTLCGAAIAYRGRLADGRVTTFGTSGFLYRSNKLMYDRLTRTLWNQMTGEPVLGPLAGKEKGAGTPAQSALELLPVVLTTWKAWMERHPGTRVLDVKTGYKRPYRAGAAYGGYFASERTLFPVWKRRGILHDKAWVYGLRVDGVPKAYPVEALLKARVINDTLAGRGVVLVGWGRPFTVEGSDRSGAKVRYRNGGEVRAYARGDVTFTSVTSSEGRRVESPGLRLDTSPPTTRFPDSLLDEQGRSWHIGEEALVGPEGKLAPRLPGHLAYWFGWYAFFPKTLVHGHPAQ